MSWSLRARWPGRLALLVALPLQLALGAGPASAGPDAAILLTTGDDYPPYTAIRLPQGGLATDLVRQAFRKAGADVQIDWLPWARGFYKVKAGAYAATFPYIRTPERDATFLYSDPLFEISDTLFVRKGLVIDPGQPETLRGRIFCLPVGWALSGALESLQDPKLVIVVRPPDIGQCVKMLQAGHADFFPSDLRQGVASLAEAGIKEGEIQPLAPPLQSIGVYLIVSRQRPGAKELVDRFNRGLRALRADGDYDRILAAHSLASVALPATLPSAP